MLESNHARKVCIGPVAVAAAPPPWLCGSSSQLGIVYRILLTDASYLGLTTPMHECTHHSLLDYIEEGRLDAMPALH